jgi:hypothetical protein
MATFHDDPKQSRKRLVEGKKYGMIGTAATNKFYLSLVTGPNYVARAPKPGV